MGLLAKRNWGVGVESERLKICQPDTEEVGCTAWRRHNEPHGRTQTNINGLISYKS